jgi:hypothetical protein
MVAETTFLIGDSFPHWFQARGRLTEFLLYSGYLEYRFKGFDTFYSPEKSFSVCNVCHSEVNSWERKFKEMSNPYLETGVLIDNLAVIHLAGIKLGMGMGVYQRIGYYASPSFFDNRYQLILS